jgi:hypothetical protein
VSQIEACDFPFVETLPKREKSRLRKLWDHFQEAKAIAAEHGMLVPCPVAAQIVGVSRQRIDQLCADGLLRLVQLGGHNYVTENSLVAWAQTERKQGRPTKAESLSLSEMRTIASSWSKK